MEKGLERRIGIWIKKEKGLVVLLATVFLLQGAGCMLLFLGAYFGLAESDKINGIWLVLPITFAMILTYRIHAR